MMFTRAASVFVLALPLLATATAVPRGDKPTSTNQCNTGSIQCCNSVQSANAPGVSTLLGLLGVGVGSVTALVGLTCSPVVGVLSGSSCTQQPVCCTGNSFNGLVVIGCSPINL